MTNSSSDPPLSKGKNNMTIIELMPISFCVGVVIRAAWLGIYHELKQAQTEM